MSSHALQQGGGRLSDARTNSEDKRIFVLDE